MTTFPDGFLWGASTAGHQVEGGNVNADLWPLEWADGSIFAEPSGDACDHYHRYPEDLALLAELGLGAYRFSLEWSRIEPEEGFFSRAALDHYRRMLATCHELGITPVVTLNHFTTPRWFAGHGGWKAELAVARFGRYAERVTEHLGDLLGWVVTLNEPNLMALLRHTGVLPMGSSERGAGRADGADSGPADATPPAAAGIGGFDAATYRPGLRFADVDRMAAAHRAAAEALRAGAGDVRVGWSLAIPDLQAVEGGEVRCQGSRQAAILDWVEVSRDDDFIGVQTYTRERIGPDGVVGPPAHAAVTQTGWEVYPAALEHSVRLAAEHARVPVLVTEHGMATADDDARAATTHAALEGLARCVADGIEVPGYLHWTLLDNFEWMAGYAMTFGLVAVDRTTLERTVKPSARWLGQVARTGELVPPPVPGAPGG